MNTSAQLATALSKKYKPYMKKRCMSTLSICLSPSVKEQATAEKTQMKTYPVNSEHLCTADYCYKQKNTNLI